ncbi:hypothetical protein J2S10_001893 [Neobacillus ginsengisoli]|uniref:Uncharacterized protein n=1 Tax=Neobacillus ginsengisoli TaxID=904295 RepID=A0ABT9XTW8_9BACI|nr:hypothetical protein [Neobacillus ginsengisoli]
MVLFFYATLNIIALFLFIKYKKRGFHILEIFVYWMVGSYLFQNFSAICYMNYKTLIIPDKFSIELAHFLNRIVLFPLLMVTFLHFFLIISTLSKKLLLIIGFILLLVGMEWLANLLGVLIHVHWVIWWSFAFWLVALLFLIVFMRFFRKFLFKGGLNF